jgi:hypothetical protein
MSCGGGHLGFPIGIKNTHLVFYGGRETKMAPTPGHRLKIEPMGERLKALFSQNKKNCRKNTI